jgi:acylphosphatase
MASSETAVKAVEKQACRNCEKGADLPPSWSPSGEGLEAPQIEKTMRSRRTFAMVILATLGLGTFAGNASMQQKQAISATVTGNDQQVGFRAMIMKQAVEYNLAGSAKNDKDEIVQFTLQGDANRIDAAVAAIREGTKKSSDIKVSTTTAEVDPTLSTFTIIDWTSTSRNITTPYTLVFKLRADDSVISKAEAKSVWHEILKTTLKGDDLKKLGGDD